MRLRGPLKLWSRLLTLRAGVPEQDYLGAWYTNRVDVENNVAHGHADEGADGSFTFSDVSDVTFKNNGASL